ncbi:MAG: type II toxin-antitoxin system VapC family toxin [Candidatus Brocadiia bacterium]
MFLLDTDTLIFLLRGEQEVFRNVEAHGEEPKAISVISYGELLHGAARSARPEAHSARVRRLAEVLPILDVTPAIMDTFAAVKADLERHGRALNDFDLIIAATAMSINYRLVTKNERHFQHIAGLRLENWTKPRG